MEVKKQNVGFSFQPPEEVCPADLSALAGLQALAKAEAGRMTLATAQACSKP